MKAFRYRALARVTLAIAIASLSSFGFSAMAQTATAGPYEFDNVQVPERISIVAEDLNYPWWPYNFKPMRYVTFPGQATTKMVPAPGSPTAKNPEGVIEHGPGQIQNRTPGSGYTQWLAFRVRTHMFFSTVVGGHLAFMLRANFPTRNVLNNEAYDGIGVIFYQWRDLLNQITDQGVAGERFCLPKGPACPDGSKNQKALTSITVQDDVTYLVEVHAAPTHIAYRVLNETHGTTTDWVNYTPPIGYSLASGTGLAFGVLCNDDNGRCENFTGYNVPYRVDIWDIASGWM